jgi:hypothetical protein
MSNDAQAPDSHEPGKTTLRWVPFRVIWFVLWRRGLPAARARLRRWGTAAAAALARAEQQIMDGFRVPPNGG